MRHSLPKLVQAVFVSIAALIPANWNPAAAEGIRRISAKQRIDRRGKHTVKVRMAMPGVVIERRWVPMFDAGACQASGPTAEHHGGQVNRDSGHAPENEPRAKL